MLGRALILLGHFPEAERALEQAWTNCLEWNDEWHSNPAQLQNAGARTALQFIYLHKTTGDLEKAETWEKLLADLERPGAFLELRSHR